MVTRGLTFLATPRSWPRLFLVLAAFGYAAFIYVKGSPFAAGSDSSGYLNSARLLAAGKFTTSVNSLPQLTPPDWHYYWQEPLGFTAQHLTPRMAPTYPTGLPLHLALAAPIVGWEKAARLVNVLNVLAAAALLYGLARQLALARVWALIGVAFLWTSPLFIFQSLQPLSDALALTWSLAAILCALKSRQNGLWAMAAGAAWAIAVLVRPTSLLIALPLSLALPFSARRWLAAAVGSVPGAAWFFYYNTQAYGSAFTTGYGDISAAFESRFIVGNLAHFTCWVPLLVSLPLTCAAILLPWRRPTFAPPRTILMLGTWIGVLVVFYAPYFCAGSIWSEVRFLLPGFPAVVLAGLLVAQAWRPAPPWWLLALCLSGQGLLSHQLHVTGIREQERAYRVATRWLETQVAPGSVVITAQLSGAAQYYNQLNLVRWDILPPDQLPQLRAAAAKAQQKIYAAVFIPEISALNSALPAARWEQIGETPGVKFFQLIPEASR